ncbi:hypothetical protein E2C01_026556 [Portunus trituberculatus]|uniref:Uncharacterized protein n=1 Tax=Portunus trituberculatus TaxID=210409 RepID=A0A5B7EGF0_PORTR|nr:hypothetical protein [Portunus trituberculatus]MPC33213.1 hypothetical protein [Portunus trituberculatus]
MTRFHIHSAYYMVILFRNLCGIKIVRTLATKLLTSIDHSQFK